VNVIRQPEWSCRRCGYRMDMVESPLERGASPRKGDLTICFNCTALYERTADEKWRAMTDEEVAKLEPRVKAQLKELRRAIRAVVPVDLAFEQKDKRK
jgi:hypothetical protein